MLTRQSCQRLQPTAPNDHSVADANLLWCFHCLSDPHHAREQPSVIGNGVLLSMALLGKITVGPLMTPVLPPSQEKAWDRQHWGDCCIVGFSMAGEAKFAFLVPRFGLEKRALAR
jgi:hypothetical protein